MITKVQIVTGVLCLCVGTFAFAGSNEKNASTELQQATQVIDQMHSQGADKAIPNDVLEKAKCVAVIPKLVKGAFVIGGEHGTGVATCKTSEGTWSAPAPFALSGISWGPQIGGTSTDLVMFMMNNQAMTALMEGHIKVGASVSAAAGPVGRQASGSAGYKAGILTYSHSKGAFIGASLNGADISQDTRATKDWYGKDISFKQILEGQAKMPNSEARNFVNAVQNAKETAQVH